MINRFEGLYLRGDVGYVELDRATDTTSITAARGLNLGASIGLVEYQGPDLAIGVEVGDQVALLDRGEGVRQAISAVVVLQIYLPFFH